MPLDIVVMEGDGIGPEVTRAALAALEAADKRFDLDIRLTPLVVGTPALQAQGTTWPDGTSLRLAEADGLILAPVSTFEYPDGQPNPSARARGDLDLFANIRPARTRSADVPRAFDLVVFRENSEGFYADRNMYAGSGEFCATPDVALSVRKITRQASVRIAKAAFEAARTRGGRVTAVHKANVLRMTDGLFLKSVREVAASYPDVTLEDVIVDAMAAHLVRDPARFDVVVTTNMYGDILSDLAGELAGGLGLAPSLNAGEHQAMAQAVHGSAPDIAGKGIANPAALILSVALLLRWLGARGEDSALGEAADAIEVAVDGALARADVATPDVAGGTGTTESFGDAVAEAIASP